MYAQAYFAYDSKKSGGVTTSHLRFGKNPIRSPYLVKTADFVACHQQAYLAKYDIVSDLKDGGNFLLNCQWSQEELDTHLPASVKKYIGSQVGPPPGIRWKSCGKAMLPQTIIATGRIRELAAEMRRVVVGLFLLICEGVIVVWLHLLDYAVLQTL